MTNETEDKEQPNNNPQNLNKDQQIENKQNLNKDQDQNLTKNQEPKIQYEIQLPTIKQLKEVLLYEIHLNDVKKE